MRDPVGRFVSASLDIAVLLRDAHGAQANQREAVNAAIAKARGVMAKMPLDVGMDKDDADKLFEALEDLISDVQKALSGAENKIDGACEALNGIGSVVG